MAYVISGDTLGLAIGPVSETAEDVHEALRKARQMYETGLVNVSIKDDAGHKIDGEELLACMTEKINRQRPPDELGAIVTTYTQRQCPLWVNRYVNLKPKDPLCPLCGHAKAADL
jgi:hypothetical protein